MLEKQRGGSPQLTPPPDIVDARRSDPPRLDCRPFILLARLRQIGKQVRPACQVLAIKALVEQVKQRLGRMQPLRLRPGPQIDAPRLSGSDPPVTATMQPAGVLVWPEAVEAPVGRRLVELLP